MSEIDSAKAPAATSPVVTSALEAPAMPPRRVRNEQVRVQVNARVRVEVEQRLQRFVREHDTTVQDCVDLALSEFLTLRGYPTEMAAG
jgi:hypothetical protein